MPQPDTFLLIDPSHGGQAQISADNYIERAPELICEIAASSAAIDLHEKFEIYQRSGVREYIIWRTFDRAIDYFVLREGTFARHSADPAGRFRSDVFPGLWLDAAALLRNDVAALLRSLQEGIGSPEHADFVRHLGAAGQ
jgi:Uma2 family endonuclease